MNYKELFNELLLIIDNDYSGYKDKVHLDNRKYYQDQITDTITCNQFYDIVTLYLRDFKDHHLALLKKDGFSNGFLVRRYHDSLYVTETWSEKDIQVGDEITKIDNKNIKEFAKEYHNWLEDDLYERQNFSEVLKKHSKITIIRDGKELEFKLNKYVPTPQSPIYEFKIREGIPYLKLTDFNDSHTIHTLIEENLATILKNDYLVIDVRVNNGGSDLSYFPMLDFMFSSETSFNSLYGGAKMSILYSERNTKLRIELFNEYLQQELPEEVRKYLKREIEIQNELSGQGFITHESSDDVVIKGNKMPKHIYVLTDTYCGSSGDSFVYLAKKSSKVTVVGRNTMGVLDYSNCATYQLGEFELMYPTSRMSWVEEGKGIDYKGVDVDVYIPFTPQHLKEDVDFNWVLKDIKAKHNKD